MTIRAKAALTAALSIAVIAPLAGLAGASAVTANDISDSSVELVPQTVMAAALAEERSVPENVYLPALPRPAALAGKDRAESSANASLSALVQQHGELSTSNREHECLAGAVYFESKGESLDGQLAVAQVVLNRSRSGRFPGSVCGVVFQPSQFSFVRGGGFPPIARSSQDWREAVGVATVALQNLKRSPVNDSLFFHARYVSPGWRLTRVATIGNHIFYR